MKEIRDLSEIDRLSRRTSAHGFYEWTKVMIRRFGLHKKDTFLSNIKRSHSYSLICDAEDMKGASFGRCFRMQGVYKGKLKFRKTEKRKTVVYLNREV